MAKQNNAFVFIHLDGKWVPCGYLTIQEDNRDILSTFQYGKKYLRRINAVSIDPVQLPLGDALFRSTPKSPLFGGIRDTAPDAWGRHLLDKAADPQSPGEFEYLTALPVDDRIGALSFGSSLEQGPGPIDPGWANYPPHGAELDLDGMIKAVDQITNEKAISPEYRRFLVRGSSWGAHGQKRPQYMKVKCGWLSSAGSTMHGVHAALKMQTCTLPEYAVSLFLKQRPFPWPAGMFS